MLIRNVTKEELYWALACVNRRFDNNIDFNRIEQAQGRTRAGLEKWHVTLTVRNTYGSGARFYPSTRRHVHAACWHVHGRFFDALPMHYFGEPTPQVEIVISAGGNYTTTGKIKISPGDHWRDWSMGYVREGFNLPYYPYQYHASQACHCSNLWESWRRDLNGKLLHRSPNGLLNDCPF